MRGFSYEERRLLQMMNEDEFSEREMARQLGISVITLGERRKSVIKKLGVRTPGDAVRRARDLKLIN